MGVTAPFRMYHGPEKNRPNAVKIDGNRIKLPRVGWVKMREALRFDGRVLSVVVSRQADRWYASVAVEFEHEVPERQDNAIAGCDLGIRVFATMFDGRDFRKDLAPKPLRWLLGRVRKLSRSLSRKTRGSRNQAKAKTKLARLNAHIADARLDALHRVTTSLVRDYRIIGIEDLNVAGMLANRHLARAVGDIGFGEFRRQLGYKSAMYGSTVIAVDRWFPSSKLCSSCGWINEALQLGISHWSCSACGIEHDRDENAARNLYSAASSAVAACGAGGAGSVDFDRVKPLAEKQEGLPVQTGTVRRSRFPEISNA